MTPRQIVAVPDDAELSYCACEAGRKLKAVRAAKAEILRAEWEKTRARNDAARALATAKAFDHAEVPPRYRGWGLKEFRNVVDAGKRAAYEAAYKIIQAGGRITGASGVEKYGLGLYGAAPGIGKTTLASIVFSRLLERVTSALWIDYPQMIYAIQGGYADGSVYAVVRQMSNVDLLLVDDLGKQDREAISPSVLDGLTKIISARYDWQRITIWTSQKDPDELGAMIRPDNLDRLRALTEPIQMGGATLRKF